MRFGGLRIPAPRALLLAAVVLLLSGCYLPVRFDAEIEITRYGTYNLIFDGYMVSVPIYDGLRKGEITPAEEKEKVEVTRRDLTRDSATKRASYLGKGIFNVHWQKSGDLIEDPMVTFLRRNQAFLTIKFLRTNGQVTVEAISLTKEQEQRLAAIGLGMEGQIRVKTQARVVEHNATRITDDAERFYVWDVRGVDSPLPRMVLALR
jgi:Fe2+ transport system protein FeoA